MVTIVTGLTITAGFLFIFSCIICRRSKPEEEDSVSDEEITDRPGASDSSSPGQAVDITRTNVTSSRTRFPGQTQETTCDEASPSPPPAAVKEIAQNTYRRKGVTWCRETDAEKRERTEKDAMTNEPRDIEEGELSERKPAASHYKKAGVGKGHNPIHNQEIQSRKPRPTKNLDDHEGQTRRPRRENGETGVGRSEIARAGEALLAKPNVQSAIAAALAMNEDGSTGENQHN